MESSVATVPETTWRKVYVTNYASHDYTDAERYGEICFVTRGFISFQSLDRVRYQVAQGLKGATADDWLALSGTNIINVLAAILWFQRFGRCKILNFDKTTQKYREIIMTPENISVLMEAIEGET